MRHRILSHLNILVIARPRVSPLTGDTQCREIERITRLKLASLPIVRDRQLVLTG